MARRWLRGRQARFAALWMALAMALGAGLGFERMRLRGVEAGPARAAVAPVENSGAALRPGEFASAFAAGIARLREGDAHGAARSFEVARLINPHAPEVYLNLGVAYLELGQPSIAQALFERASSIAPMMPEAYYGMAEVMEARGDLEGARGAMSTYLHLAPEDAPFRHRAMAALWEWDAARGQAEQGEAVASLPPAPETSEAPLVSDTAAFASGAVPNVHDAPIETLDGAPTSLAAYRGRYLVLNVWATWCGPCRAELPSLDGLAAALGAERLAVVGVSMDRERVFTREFLRELGVGFPSYWDREGKLTREILDAHSIPLTVVVSPEGEVLLGYEGARDWSEPALVAAISGLADGDAPFADRLARLKEELQ